MFDQGFLWGIATVIGPLLLLGAMIYGVAMYGRRSRASKQHTENATRALYRQGEQQERRAEDAQEISSPPVAPTRRRPL